MNQKKNTYSRVRTIVSSTLLSCVTSIAKATLLFNPLLFHQNWSAVIKQQVCSWLLKTGKISIDRTHVHYSWHKCLFQLVNKLLQQWWLKNIVRTLLPRLNHIDDNLVHARQHNVVQTCKQAVTMLRACVFTCASEIKPLNVVLGRFYPILVQAREYLKFYFSYMLIVFQY